MMNAPLAILDPASPRPAQQVVPEGTLDEEALAVVETEGNSRSWIESLLKSGFVSDAIRVLALVLPKKYAIAWACECMRRALADVTAPRRQIDRAGIALAERWLARPTEEHRLAALEFAERGKFSSAGAWIAAAAGWAEGSMAPKDVALVAPPETLSGEAVAAALLTLALADVSTSEDWLRECALQALASFGGLHAAAVS